MGSAALCVSCARDFHASLPVNVNRKAAAIEALQVGTAEMVRRADQLRRRSRDGGPAFSWLLIGLSRNAAARCKRQ